jgi:ligand-binding sensor domain-containing protein
MGTLTGLAHVTSSSGAVRVRQYGVSHGRASANIAALTEDSHGDVWIGTDGGGAMRLAAAGFTSYGREEGLDLVLTGVAASKTGSPYL